MTSSSRRVDARSTALLCTCLFGCSAGDEVFETQVIVLAETMLCEEARLSEVRVSAYRVVLFEVQSDPMSPSMASFCVACLDEGTCVPAQEACACGPPSPPGTVALNRGLAGTRFVDLDPERRYCIGVAAYHLPELDPGTGEVEPCDCGFEGIDLTTRTRMCGISPSPGTVGENAPAIPVGAECRLVCRVPDVP